jgi:transposase-like protein
MKKEVGRPHKLPSEIRRLIAQQVTTGEVTYRRACEKYGVSSGAVAKCVKEFKGGGIKTNNPPRWTDEERTPREKALEMENKILKAEVGELYLQMKLLKKAEDYKQWLKNEASSVITSENLEQLKTDVN